MPVVVAGTLARWERTKRPDCRQSGPDRGMLVDLPGDTLHTLDPRRGGGTKGEGDGTSFQLFLFQHQGCGF